MPDERSCDELNVLIKSCAVTFASNFCQQERLASEECSVPAARRDGLCHVGTGEGKDHTRRLHAYSRQSLGARSPLWVAA